MTIKKKSAPKKKATVAKNTTVEVKPAPKEGIISLNKVKNALKEIKNDGVVDTDEYGIPNSYTPLSVVDVILRSKELYNGHKQLVLSEISLRQAVTLLKELEKFCKKSMDIHKLEIYSDLGGSISDGEGKLVISFDKIIL